MRVTLKSGMQQSNSLDRATKMVVSMCHRSCAPILSGPIPIPGARYIEIEPTAKLIETFQTESLPIDVDVEVVA